MNTATILLLLQTEFQLLKSSLQSKKRFFRQNDETKQTVRAEVSSILRRAKTPPRNIDSNVFKALIALRKDSDRVVLSAGKGNCVVVMDKH